MPDTTREAPNNTEATVTDGLGHTDTTPPEISVNTPHVSIDLDLREETFGASPVGCYPRPATPLRSSDSSTENFRT